MPGTGPAASTVLQGNSPVREADPRLCAGRAPAVSSPTILLALSRRPDPH